MIIDGFNEACNNISASYTNFGDESMSEISFHTTVKGGLPHLSFVFRNLEPLGEVFKTMACSITGAFLFIDIQRWKDSMNKIKYPLQLGLTAVCTKMIMEATKGIGQRDIKGDTEDF